MADVIMPKMSDAMEEGKVLRWIKRQGEDVQKGEPIVEIETDKANVELEAPESGVVQEIHTEEGESVPIGTPIAVIGLPGVVSPEEKEEEVPPAPPAAPAPPPAAEVPRPPEEEIKASPLARKIARDAGVDLRDIQGTGPGGRIVEADVRAFIERGGRPAPPAPERPPVPPPEAPPAPAAPPETAAGRVQIGRIWQTVGKRMTESKQHVPHFYITMEVDMEEAIRMRRWLNSVRPEDRQISLNDVIIKACAVALVKHPTVNASYASETEMDLHDTVNIGIAVAIPEGLITPVVRNCERKSLTEISDEARELIRRTRAGEIRPEEYSGATFTLTNLGMYGVEDFAAIIVPPQAAILASGAAIPKPVVIDDKIEIRNTMRITVAGDHRVTDGARVAEFMRDVKQALERSMTLLE